jgi:hypothetical protein
MKLRYGWGTLAFMALLQAGAMWAGEKQPAPAVKISLESLGYPGASQSFLDAGASMLTVNFLDDKHLLVTFSERNLVPRLVGDPEEHDDRLVAGEVVELPTGKVLAKTEWHMHDHARYLWPLGRGRFLLRIEDTLYTMAPLARLTAGEGAVNPFARTVLPGRQMKPTLVYTSEDGGMLTVESQVNVAKGSGAIEVSNTTVVPQTVTIVDFYRLEGDGSAESALAVTPVGEVRAPEPFYLPITADGYMWPQPSGNNKWALMFDDFTGKTRNVATLDSSCSPRVEMVSAAEFVAMTCRGAAERIRLGSYGMDGTETWQEDVGDYGVPTFAYAPAAGRFAVSHRTERAASPGGLAGLIPGNGPGQVPSGVVDQSASEGQEVRVYQNASGDLLLKVQASPALKTAENFDISADGTEAVVTKDGQVMVYKLPALSKRDKEDIAEVAKFAPAATTGAVRLTLLVGPAANPARRRLPITDAAGAKSAGVGAAAPAVDLPAQTAGDAPANASPGRKPPTLLKPGEKPEFGKSNAGDGAGAPPPQ